MDNSIEKLLIRDVSIGFYYNFVKLDKLHTININFNIQLVNILVNRYSMLYLIMLTDIRR